MKIGYINTISGATFSGGSNPSYASENDSLKVTTLTDGQTLTITPASGVLIDFVAIFNYDGSSCEVVVTQTAAGATTTNLTTTNKTGWAYNNYLVPVSSNTDTVTSITIENDSGSSADIGYVYAGLWINFGCLEAQQPFDESTDNVTVGRANNAYYDEGYRFLGFNVTTAKEVTFETLQTNIRKILDTGFALKRPFYFDTEPVMSDEMFLGILGSGRIGYDIYDIDGSGSNLTQCSFEIREVT